MSTFTLGEHSMRSWHTGRTFLASAMIGAFTLAYPGPSFSSATRHCSTMRRLWCISATQTR